MTVSTGVADARPRDALQLPTDPRLILATDLDGTFLGGSETERRELYGYLERHRQQLLLVFVTGRDLGFIDELKSEGIVPHPDFVIGDVGTTIVAGHDFQPVAPVQDPIAELWGDAGERVRALLADEPGIRPQPTRFERRMSYYYDPATFSEATLRKIEQAGFDWLTSAETFLDVLPRGVRKGPTLLRFLEALDLPAERTLVAGDTLNDLSLFETGLDGVAVGNSEPKLVARLSGLPRTYHSPRHGAAGILDAIHHFGKTLDVRQEGDPEA